MKLALALAAAGLSLSAATPAYATAYSRACVAGGGRMIAGRCFHEPWVLQS